MSRFNVFYLILFLLVFQGRTVFAIPANNKNIITVYNALLERSSPKTFGAWSISKELFEYIRSTLPSGSTILELGSGWATGQLAEYYTMYSVEHDPSWVGRYNSHYIYAPIKNGWYDTEVLKKELPDQYDLLLIDGPPGIIGRSKFFDNIQLFHINIPLIFDDIHRPKEHQLFMKVACHLDHPTTIIGGGGKKFGVVLPITK